MKEAMPIKKKNSKTVTTPRWWLTKKKRDGSLKRKKEKKACWFCALPTKAIKMYSNAIIAQRRCTWARIVGSVNYLRDKHILARHTLRYNLVSGDKVRFWKDIWLDDHTLSTRFPRLFRLENDQNCLVRHRWINGHWWWDWRRDVRGGDEHQQLQLLTEAVLNVALHEGQDKLWWDIDTQATRWCSLLPRKVNIFMWQARLDNLSRKGIEIASIMCPVCGVSMESISHVLFTCTLAREVWSIIYNWCQVSTRDMNDLSEWLDWCDHNTNVRNRKVNLEVIGVSTCWFLWRYRNSVVFYTGKMRKRDLVDNIILYSFNWLKYRNPKFCITWVEWLQNPLYLY
ncbi:RNA-directed DNA polymerase, eukaryota [Artemisia annua]|uniref:RNA-directed DNA polymerase, eukaryota n=1 Tax=Artemisia annua TaxID=35608 RepID=A0A2U1KXT0_ARTAN|nr:RNA-directed DNA polymerase, eukaryota [Artemisia annua]